MNSFGRRLLALAFAVFGILYLLHAVDHAFFPGPPWQAAVSPVTNAVAGLLFVGAAAVLGLPKASFPFYVGVTTLLLAYTACLHWTAIFANPANPLPWTSTCEVVGLAGGCLAASGSAVRGGRILYGLSLIIVAVQHVRFHAFVATLVPAWYPMNAIWPYVTAAGFTAGTISYLTGLQVRLASILLAVMFLLFALTLHAPDVVAHLASGGRWTSMFVALGFAGGALVFAGSASSKSA
jgi:putative oxidoreductase